ncbi:MAG: hypothetical protein ABIQ90_12305 [Polaromonas sp.]
MTVHKVLASRISIIRTMLGATFLVLAACSNGAGNRPPETAKVSVSGNLTLKGAEPGAWWAVTDDQGRIWKMALPTPDQIAIFQKAQNHRVRVEGQRQANYLNFEQIRPERIIAEP